MPFDEALAERLPTMFRRIAGPSERRMFGGVCFMVSGRMCCGIVGNDLMVRVGAPNHDDALRRPHTCPMDFTGKPLRGFVYVGAKGYRSGPSLAAWVQRAVRFARTQPPRSRRSPRPWAPVARRRGPRVRR